MAQTRRTAPCNRISSPAEFAATSSERACKEVLREFGTSRGSSKHHQDQRQQHEANFRVSLGQVPSSSSKTPCAFARLHALARLAAIHTGATRQGTAPSKHQADLVQAEDGGAIVP
eukprot:CAMPEP_0115173968 /NCGR_PEP_ID=MMETSP0270-20121206/3597_1 /TAXON_ID=71861 /ORGANISM="Scrippsiella trochoidea, Strain CCMP3099" /LENGTH=115 /DNA_ID=CAMNT_0002586793 /DNA_START=339 /DNA_END=687 /DNA_ORIENTATION=-